MTHTAENDALVTLAREAIAAVGGSHSHWRAGGAGGVCGTCTRANERQEELGRRLDALVAQARVTPTATTKESADD